MTTTERMSLWVAILAIVGGAITTVLSGKYQMETAQAQIQKDVRLAQVQALEKEEQLVREKFEALMVEMSDLISYMDANNIFPVAVAKERLAKCRKAAFALSAHAGPKLSLAALAVVEATNSAFAPSAQDMAVVAGAARAIAASAAQVRSEFDMELSVFAEQGAELVRGR
ncbi:MAG: hypothetical protein ACREX0_05960 [Noviherbaspirillum sp.]